MVTSEEVMLTLELHASVAVALPNDGVAGQLIGDTTAGHVMVGAVMSCNCGGKTLTGIILI